MPNFGETNPERSGIKSPGDNKRSIPAASTIRFRMKPAACGWFCSFCPLRRQGPAGRSVPAVYGSAWKSRSGAAARYPNGSMTSTPHPSKSRTFLVATVASLERATAAIWASICEIGRPERRRAATIGP